MTTDESRAEENVLDGKLTPKQETAIAHLLSERTIAAAATASDISEATLLRWLKKPEFATAYRDARREVVTHAITGLQRSCSEAVATLLAIATNPEAPAAARVTAARTILDTSIRAVELEDLAARVEALEFAMGGRK
jgi:DNA-binding MurR/RpiR family transcriptional regulator